jgi:ankyrin repeat protein
MQKFLPLLSVLFSLHLAAQQSGTTTQTNAPKPLFSSIRSGDLNALRQQLTAGASPNDSLDGYSALMAATLCGSTEEMKLLIDHGANVNYENTQHITALWLAVPDLEKTTLLLNNGADVNHRIEGYSVLVKCASIPGSAGLMQMLIAKGAEPHQSAPDNYWLYNAALSGDTANLALVLRYGFKVNDTVSIGDYPVNAAQGFRNFLAVRMLIDNGANVNARSMYFKTLPAMVGFSPLMNAALNADKASLLYLLDHGADPNLKTRQGMTALLILQQSETDDPDMTLALLKHGADPGAKDRDGTDALAYAMKCGHVKSAAMLRQYSKR